MADGRASFRRSLLWTLAERYAGLALNFVALVVLARLLTPEEFGVYAIAAAVIAITGVVREFGITNYLIQAPELPDWRLRTAGTLALAMGFGLGGLLFAAAPLVGRAYDDATVAPVLQLLSVALALSACSLVPFAMLARELRFATLFAVQTLAAALNTASVITAAALGLGALSPAVGSVVAGVVCLVGGGVLWPPRRWLGFGLRDWRPITSFSFYVVGAALLAEVGRVGPALMVGRTLGLDAAGLLNRGQAVSLLFQKAILQAAKRAALPVLAQNRRNGQDLRRPFLAKVSFMAAVAWPAGILFVTLADPLVRLVLGRGWEAVVPLVQVLSAALFVLPLTALNNEFFISMGRARLQLWVEGLAQGSRLLLVAVAAFHSLPLVALAMVASRVVTAVASTLLLTRLLDCGGRELTTTLLRSLPLALGALCGPALAWGIGLYGDAHPLLPLAVAGAAAVAGWLVAVWAAAHPVGGEIGRLLAPLPFLRRWT